MKEPSLQKTTALSFVLHLTVFLVAFFILKQPNHIISLPSYTVRLVSPDVFRDVNEGRKADVDTMKESAALSDILKKDISDIPKKDIKEITKKEKEIVEKRISALAAKEKLQKLAKFRSKFISLKAGELNRKGTSKTTVNSQASTKGDLFDDYYSKITREIWQQWVFPYTGQKDIEATISIRILKDGTITAQRIEKSSGNPIFDRSAIKALAKASPLSPPPYEMEIGIRFYP